MATQTRVEAQEQKKAEEAAIREQDKENGVTVITENGKQVALSVYDEAYLVEVQEGKEKRRYGFVNLVSDVKQFEVDSKELRKRGQSIGNRMVMLAKIAGTPGRFKALCEEAEFIERIGRPPAGAPDKVKAEFTSTLPGFYRTYKSEIIAAMEAGIEPGGKAQLVRRLPRPDKETGKREKVEEVELMT